MAENVSIPSIAQRVTSEAAAYEYLEELRWKGKPVCPHCGSVAAHYFLTPKSTEGRKTRTGSVSQRRVWKCKDCRKQFSVLTGTIFHGTKIPVRTWLFVVFEMASSKNGVAAREIERKYGLTPKTAWFMCHRIREAMKREPMAGMLSGTIVADETWIGGKPKNFKNAKRSKKLHWKSHDENKTPVFTLVNRETGEARSRVIADVQRDTLRKAIRDDVDIPNSVLHTDSAAAYVHIGWEFQDHQSVNHTMSEYVRDGVTTNHAEGYFAQLKRSLDGTHHHVSREHLPRYLAEFDYRWSTCKMTDTERMRRLMGRTGGRRLTYKQPRGRA